MAVAVRHQFVGSLGCCIKLQGMVNAPVLAKWHPGIRPINAAGACIRQMGNPRMPACFQNVGESNNVAVYIRVWILQAVANAGLGGEMDHAVERVFRKARSKRHRIGQIEPVTTIKGTSLRRYFFQKFETGLLDRWRVVIVHYVDPNNRISAPEQPGGSMKANKAGIASDQDLHLKVPRCWFSEVFRGVLNVTDTQLL